VRHDQVTTNGASVITVPGSSHVPRSRARQCQVGALEAQRARQRCRCSASSWRSSRVVRWN